MYCKKCGKKISEKTRFCDRCGHPVKTTSTSRHRASSTSGNHAPKRKRDSYDVYRKNKMKREAEQRRKNRKRKNLITFLIIFALIGAVFAALLTYSKIVNDNAKNSAIKEEFKTPELPGDDDTLDVSDEDEEDVADDTVIPDDDNEGEGVKSRFQSDDYSIYVDEAYGFECPYPVDFVESVTKSDYTRLSRNDPEGDGFMMISYEEIASTQTANSLMKEYIRGIGVDEFDNRSGENWYQVTFNRGAKINHRMAVIINTGELMYYDFTYDVTSEFREKYNGYMEYIDGYLEEITAEGTDSNTVSE